MDFDHQIIRAIGTQSGTTYPNVGTDAAPTTNTTAATPNSPYGGYKSVTTTGVPVKALLVSFVASNASANASANIYIRDTSATAVGGGSGWVLWSANIALVPNTLTSVTMPAPASQRGIPTSVEYYFMVNSAGANNGLYFFDISPGL